MSENRPRWILARLAHETGTIAADAAKRTGCLIVDRAGWQALLNGLGEREIEDLCCRLPESLIRERNF